MPQHDVFPNPSGNRYLLDVQTDLLDGLNTRMIRPLLPISSTPKPATRLNPYFEIVDAPVVMPAQFMAAVPTGVRGLSVVKFEQKFDRITVTIDMRLQGFEPKRCSKDAPQDQAL